MSDLHKMLVVADYQTTLRQKREILKSEFQDACVFAFNGGLFELTPEFLAGLEIRAKYSDSKSLWVLDRNQTAVQVADINGFIKEAVEQYNQAVETFGKEWDSSRRQRAAMGIINQ
jgi:hypothetical protein